MIEVATILYGSQNYGLDIETSDYDYKMLMTPTFDELYENHIIQQSDLPARQWDKEHYGVMDIRNFDRLIRKGNPNCIEMLFSVRIAINEPFFSDYLEIARRLYENGYVANIWHSFVPAAKGLAISHLNNPSNKVFSRIKYWNIFLQEVMHNGFIINDEVWRHERYDEARAIRYKKELIDSEPIMQEFLATYEQAKSLTPPVNEELNKHAEKLLTIAKDIIWMGMVS